MKQSLSASFWGWPAIVALSVLALDQATKWLTVAVCPVPGTAECIVIPHLLRFVHWRNQGAAFSLFYGHKLLLGLLSLTVACALIIYFRKLFGDLRGGRWAGAVLLGGVAGNLIDRFFYADGVVDFIRFDFWPAFNVADSAICCAMCFLVIQALRGKKGTLISADKSAGSPPAEDK